MSRTLSMHALIMHGMTNGIPAAEVTLLVKACAGDHSVARAVINLGWRPTDQRTIPADPPDTESRFR